MERSPGLGALLQRMGILAAAGLLGCTSRAELPMPESPFTPTPDASFRSRVVVPVEVNIPERRIDTQTLENGLTVLHVEMPDSPEVATLFINRQGGPLPPNTTRRSSSSRCPPSFTAVHAGAAAKSCQVSGSMASLLSQVWVLTRHR